ncbi:MAG: hypothetical protein Q9217_003510 [Psora testacea]
MADRQRVENAIQGLRAFQEPSLSIIRLSEPISAAPTSQRNSDISSSAFADPSPASLEADLSHYRELFSKLRFSYLEQVTKEKFLRAIVGEPPQIVEPAENIELESQLASIKSVLKEQKQHVANMVAELEETGRGLSRRYETVSLQTELLKSLPAQIDGLKGTLEELRRRNHSSNEARSDDPNLNLPLPATQGLVEERKAELEEVNKQLQSLQQALPRQTIVVEREEKELEVLEQEKERAVLGAREVMERKREGDGADELELRGRWLRSADTALRRLLGVEA